MIIRNVTKSDYDNIYNLVKTAFETAKVADGNEQEFVYELRKRDTYLPECEFVAEKDGKLVGHILLSKQEVIKDDGSKFYGVMIAPLCVSLEERNKGIGGMLISNACMMAAELGYFGAFLMGDPEYYNKFGFRETNEYDIKNDTDVDDKYVLACPTRTGGLKGVSGKVKLG